MNFEIPLWRWFTNLLCRRVEQSSRVDDLLYEAEKEYLYHHAEAARHQALADMYEERVNWCRAQRFQPQ